MKNITERINRNKMKILKVMVMIQNGIDIGLYGECDYEFDVKGETITMLYIWMNPNGKHNYQKQYEKTFKMNVNINAILD